MRDIKNVVIIDNSAYKVRDLESAIYKIYPDAERYVFSNANEGLRYITVERIADVRADPEGWLIVTDMQMPIMPGAGVDRLAGRHVLNQLHSQLVIHELVRVPLVLVSSEEQDSEWLKSLYVGCLGHVRYSPFVSVRQQLRELLEPGN